MKRITVTLESADGRERTYTVFPAYPDAPFVELEWERPPVEDTEEMERTNSPYRIMKPGPIVNLTLRASGRPEA